MTIRVAERHRFVVVDSTTVNDEKLSLRARGLLVWLLDKPDGWRVSADSIVRFTTEGRDAIRTALKELEVGGYLRRERSQGPDGKWVTVSVIYEQPPCASPLENGVVQGADPSTDAGTDDWKTDDWKTDDGKTDDGNSGPITSTNTKNDDPKTCNVDRNQSPLTTTDTVETPTTVKPAAAALATLPKSVNQDDVKHLCLHLRERIGELHPGRGKPKITAAWVKAMGTLLNSGVKGWEGQPPTPNEVAEMIDLVFTHLNTPNNSGFCWANQVQSPDALRRHWMRMRTDWEMSRRSGRTSADSTKVAENAAALREILGK